ncbi:MAG TPA: hypothetical protein VEH04_17170 [Verrucomicrobiae bacterium]|nr:hypothetical protein [Verrucomicrobiae bacterium]
MKLATFRQKTGLSRTTEWRLRKNGVLPVAESRGRLIVDLGRQRNIARNRYGAILVEHATEETNRLGETLWQCRCDCGKTFTKSRWHLINGPKHCGCGSKPTFEKRVQGAGEITARRWASILAGARKRGIKVPVDAAAAWDLFLKQGRRCALTGRELKISQASLDYHPGPPRWIDSTVARMKMKIPADTFLRICRDVAAADPTPPPVQASLEAA